MSPEQVAKNEAAFDERVKQVREDMDGEAPAMRTYWLRAGMTVHIHGVPVTLAGDACVRTATDLYEVNPNLRRDDLITEVDE